VVNYNHFALILFIFQYSAGNTIQWAYEYDIGVRHVCKLEYHTVSLRSLYNFYAINYLNRSLFEEIINEYHALFCSRNSAYSSGLPSWILTCTELKGHWLCFF